MMKRHIPRDTMNALFAISSSPWWPLGKREIGYLLAQRVKEDYEAGKLYKADYEHISHFVGHILEQGFPKV